METPSLPLVGEAGPCVESSTSSSSSSPPPRWEAESSDFPSFPKDSFAKTSAEAPASSLADELSFAASPSSSQRFGTGLDSSQDEPSGSLLTFSTPSAFTSSTPSAFASTPSGLTSSCAFRSPFPSSLAEELSLASSPDEARRSSSASSAAALAEELAASADGAEALAELVAQGEEALAAQLALALLDKARALGGQVQSLEGAKSALERHNGRLREQLRSLDDCFSEEEATNSGREERYASEIQALGARLNAALKDLSRVRSERDSLEEWLAEARESLAALEAALRQANAKRQRLARDKTTLQQKNAQLRSELSAARRGREAAETMARGLRRLRKERLSAARPASPAPSRPASATSSAAASTLSLDGTAIAEDALLVTTSSVGGSSPLATSPQRLSPCPKPSSCWHHSPSPRSLPRRFRLNSGGEGVTAVSPRASSSSSLTAALEREVAETRAQREANAELREEIDRLRLDLQQAEAEGHWARSQSLAVELREASLSPGPGEGLGGGEVEEFRVVDALLFPLQLLWHLLGALFGLLLAPFQQPLSSYKEE